MTNEQLEAVRLEKWRQKTNPVLTIEDAETWVAANGLSLFLPRQAQLHAPAPSFVEAVLGEANATPAPAAIQNAFGLVVRLAAEGKAIPLNLLGTASEQPDFLASPEALPYIFAMRGDRDWKRGPRGSSAPLMVETWKLLKREGVLTTAELQEQLGREVTEAAVLRSLVELWSTLRILPIYTEGGPTSWEVLESRHQKAMQTGGGMAQVMALSALVSLYLDSVIAATSDEMEAFLSPLTPRTRVRDAVRGLEATRQLSTQPLGAQTVYYITGGLPVFPEIAPAETEAVAEGQPEQPSKPFQRRKPFTSGEHKPFAARERKPFTPREGSEDRPRRTFRQDDTRRRNDEGPRRERPAFGDRPSFSKRPAAGGPRKEWKPRSEGKSFGSRPPRKEWTPRAEGEERRSFRPRTTEGRGEGGFRKPFRKREDGERGAWQSERPFRPRREEGDAAPKRPYQKRVGGSFTPRDRDQQRPRKEWTPRGEGKPFGGKSFGSRPPRKEWTPRAEGEERREFRPRRDEGKSFGSRPPRKEWTPRGEGGERREFRPRRDAGSGPRREGGSFAPKRKPFRKDGDAGFERRERPQSGERRPSTGGRKPFGKSFSRPGAKSGAPKSGAKFGPKSGSKFGKPGTKSTKFGGKKPSFGKKPGFKSPGSRPRKKSEE